jgi:hypothetical protein
MWTIGLLLRTYGGASWGPPLTWDSLISWSVNGHTISAVAPAVCAEEHEDHGTKVPADGRALAVYSPENWSGAVLVNDGTVWTKGVSFDVGTEWRAGADVTELAWEIAGRAGLTTESRSPNW